MRAWCLGVALTLLAGPAAAQGAPDPGERGLYAPSAWDLTIGAHAAELGTERFAKFACGTNGGPPSLPMGDWTGYSRCRPEPTTGYREVYFEYG